MVEEGDAGINLDDAGAIDVKFDQDVGLLGGAFHAGLAAHATFSLVICRMASKNAVVSCSVPAVTRR